MSCEDREVLDARSTSSSRRANTSTHALLMALSTDTLFPSLVQASEVPHSETLPVSELIPHSHLAFVPSHSFNPMHQDNTTARASSNASSSYHPNHAIHTESIQPNALNARVDPFYDVLHPVCLLPPLALKGDRIVQHRSPTHSVRREVHRSRSSDNSNPQHYYQSGASIAPPDGIYGQDLHLRETDSPQPDEPPPKRSKKSSRVGSIDDYGQLPKSPRGIVISDKAEENDGVSDHNYTGESMNKAEMEPTGTVATGKVPSGPVAVPRPDKPIPANAPPITATNTADNLPVTKDAEDHTPLDMSYLRGKLALFAAQQQARSPIPLAAERRGRTVPSKPVPPSAPPPTAASAERGDTTATPAADVVRQQPFPLCRNGPPSFYVYSSSSPHLLRGYGFGRPN